MNVSYSKWPLIYLILFTGFCIRPHLSLHKISATQTLSGNQTLSSEKGSFMLGFFNPGNSSNYYIGIWYNKVSPQTVVWIANRDKPVVDKYSSELRISDGNLVLSNIDSGIVIWSTNLSSVTSDSAEAVLLDEGNLVLRDGPSSSSSEPPLLWQSFDHPTHTWLPGGKLGRNKITGESIRLTSWKSKEDPAPGLFSVKLDPNGTSQFYIIKNMSEIIWKSGTWDGEIFSSVPEIRFDRISKFSYISNDNETYFTYSSFIETVISRLVIDTGGQLQYQLWSNQWSTFWSQPRDQCDVCGAFASCDETIKQPPFCHCLKGFHPKSVNDWNSEVYSGGCVRKTNLRCGNNSNVNGHIDKFLKSEIMDLPLNSLIRPVKDVRECESICLSNCSCTAYSYSLDIHSDFIECSIFYGDLMNLRHLRGDDSRNVKSLYVRFAASEFSNYNNKKRMLIGLVTGFSSLVVLVLLFILLFVIRRRIRIKNKDRLLGSMPKITSPTTANGGGQNNAQLVMFSFKSILTATDNFSEANKLGEGGFGPVYKGNFPGDQQVANKRLSKKSGQGLEEFMNEVKLIANLQHKYLVRLLGCCLERDEKILVYEYMPNRSLDKYLYDQSEREKLVWDKRLKIAEGVAQGLLYIHKFSRLKIIHRDLKASNILLDEAMNPKISDFGMARIFGINQTEANTNRVMGTYGYMSPEYAFSGQFSEKSDVFSYGVLLLEIVSGRRNTSFHGSGLSFTLLSWAWELWKEGNEEELIDESMKLDTSCSIKEVVKCIRVGLLCVQDDPIDRPTMSMVVHMLSSCDDQTFPSPKEPAFLTRRNNNNVAASSQRANGFSSNDLPIECSNNNLTISLPVGR